MERVEFQHEQKANVRNSGEGLFKKPDSYTEAKDLLKNKRPLTRVCSVRQSSRTYPTSPSERYADFGKREELTKNFCHSGSLEKYYELANSYFSCYSESINTDEKPINCIQNSIQNLSNPMVINNQTDRFRIKSGMTKNSGLPRSLALPANGFANAYRLTILALLRMFALYRNDETNLSSYPLINLSTYKRKESTTMAKNKNLKKTLEAGALTKRHSEGISPKNPLHFIKRFFAEYKFPFAGNCVRPAQNDGKILVPQCLSNLVSSSPLSLPSPSGGEGCNNVKDLFAPPKSGLLRRFAPRNDVNNLSTLKKKAAFTLAEILITLGIIGIVAAMTIPNLIAEQQKRTTVTKLQRAMSVLNQAYRRAYDDVGEATAEEASAMGSEEYFNKYWASYIKTAHICKTYQDCGYESNTPFVYINNVQTAMHLVSDGCRTTIKTMDGFTYLIVTRSGTDLADIDPKIWVDINSGAKPNRLGKDVFLFIRATDGEKGGVVLPFGYDKTNEEIDEKCTKSSSTGQYCAEKIRRAGWKIEKDYPW